MTNIKRTPSLINILHFRMNELFQLTIFYNNHIDNSIVSK